MRALEMPFATLFACVVLAGPVRPSPGAEDASSAQRETAGQVTVIVSRDFEDYETGRYIVQKTWNPSWGKRYENVPVGFTVWTFKGEPAEFVWTDRIAHSGTRNIGIEQNVVAASYSIRVSVQSGERYRISTFSTRTWTGEPTANHPYIAVRWHEMRDGKLQPTSDPLIRREIPIEISGQWSQGVLDVTAPGGATAMTVFLGVDKPQPAGSGVYFDDLLVEQIGAGGDPAASEGTGGPFLVRGKVKQATIIVETPLSDRCRWAAQSHAPADLARYIELITGTAVPLRNSADGVSGLKIRVGHSPYVDALQLNLDTLSQDGYVIRLVDDDNLVIVGGENLGTGFGVYDFLKRYCGCRWFMPGPLGEVVPRKAQIVIGDIDVRSEPVVPSAWVRSIELDNLKVKHSRHYYPAGHQLNKLVPPSVYLKTHPEYYPFVRGRRVEATEEQKPPWQPCVSNPDLPTLVPDFARKKIEEWEPWSPGVPVIPMGLNDGGGDCLCDKCTAQDIVRDGVRYMGDRYARFYNACAEVLAATFPGKNLGISAYGGMTFPPMTEILRPNIYVRVSNIVPDPPFFERMEAWSARATRLGVYDYLFGTPILEPRHYPHLLGEYVKTLVEKYRIRDFTAEVEPFWPLDAPKVYVLLELLWNSEQDVDTLLADYFEHFYAECAVPMGRFFQHLEDVYRRRENPLFFRAGVREGGFEGWTLADLASLDADLAEARRLARDEAVRARVRMVDEGWQHIRCWIEIFARTQEVRATPVRSQSEVDTVLDHARAIYAAMQRRSDWDRKVSDPSGHPSPEYYKYYVAQHYARPHPGVETDPRAEDALDKAFDRISQFLGERAPAFWREIASSDGDRTRLSALARTQIFLLAHPGDLPTLVPDGDYENTAAKGESMLGDVLQRFKWESDERLPAGYAVWTYAGYPADFVWTDRIAHSGKRCIGIENNEVPASISRRIQVRPRERYRISVFATRVWNGNPRDVRPALSVRWHNSTGLTKDPFITESAPVTEPGDWHQIALRVTVPDGATFMVVSLQVRGEHPASQVQNGGVYFDDLRVERISEPM